MATGDERLMARALELARSAPFTAPNPRVGAVVARAGEIVAEGFHRGAGTPHAEPAALEGVEASGATLYVNLEPCVHHGRTPPCAPAIAAAGIARVVIALEDPDPRVQGRGIAHLRDHGIDVTTGVLAPEARRLNAGYLKQKSTGLPLVTLKLALSLDGRMTAPDGSSRWITGEQARNRVHERRLESDAVVTGSGTVLADDPELTVRALPAARQPARVVLDARGRIPADRKIFRQPGETIVVTTASSTHEAQVAWKETGAEVVLVAADPNRGVRLEAVLDVFGRRGWHELYFEAGPTLASSLIRSGLVDRLELHYGAVLLGAGGPELADLGTRSIEAAHRLNVVRIEQLGDDVIVELER